MIVSDLSLTHGSRFEVMCRIRHPLKRVATNGSAYLTFRAEDYDSSLKAYAWADRCDLAAPLHDLDNVIITGAIREFNGEPLLSVNSIAPHTNITQGVPLIPRSMCPEPELLKRLHNVVQQIANEPLRYFVEQVCSNDHFTLPFIRLSASRRHHHSSPGGLLRHSLECAEMVRRYEEFIPDMVDLAVVGALFHDAGKIMTLQDDSTRFALAGVLLDHDALKLEVLAPHLKQLEQINKEAATALRYLWTWRHHRRGMNHPVLTIAEAISSADRISSGLDIEEMIFDGRPEWQTIVRYEHEGSKYWRPRLNSMLTPVGMELKQISAKL